MADKGRPSPIPDGGQLDLTDEEARALLRFLNDAIENDRYPLSPRIQNLAAPSRRVRAIGTPADSTAATVERVWPSCLLLKRSRPKPWHLCGLLSIGGVPGSKARFNPYLVALRSRPKVDDQKRAHSRSCIAPCAGLRPRHNRRGSLCDHLPRHTL